MSGDLPRGQAVLFLSAAEIVNDARQTNGIGSVTENAAMP